MEIGDKFIHRFNPLILCEILAITAKGAKVKEYSPKLKGRGLHTRIGFYDRNEFTDPTRGIWEQIIPQLSDEAQTRAEHDREMEGEITYEHEQMKKYGKEY